MRAGRPPADQDKECPAGGIVCVTFEFRLIQFFFGIDEKFFLKVVGIYHNGQELPQEKMQLGQVQSGSSLIYCYELKFESI